MQVILEASASTFHLVTRDLDETGTPTVHEGEGGLFWSHVCLEDARKQEIRGYAGVLCCSKAWIDHLRVFKATVGGLVAFCGCSGSICWRCD